MCGNIINITFHLSLNCHMQCPGTFFCQILRQSRKKSKEQDSSGKSFLKYVCNLGCLYDTFFTAIFMGNYICGIFSQFCYPNLAFFNLCRRAEVSESFISEVERRVINRLKPLLDESKDHGRQSVSFILPSGILQTLISEV